MDLATPTSQTDHLFPPSTSSLTKVLKVFHGDKLVVIVDGWLWVFLQLLRQCVQEGAPPRGLAQELGRWG